MKILIATPLFSPDVGGPAQYAFNLEKEWQSDGHNVKLVKFSDVRNLPSGIRHFAYFFKVLAQLVNTDFVLILDTLSVALPTILAAKIFRKKVIIRVGGDFLWEKYVEQTPEVVRLSEFYTKLRQFSFKEKIIFKFTRAILKWADVIVFNTDWLRQIWLKPYNLNINKTKIIENYFKKNTSFEAKTKTFLSSSRKIKLKNHTVLTKSFALAKSKHPEIVLDIGLYSPDIFKQKIAEAYAIIVPSVSEVSPNLVLDGLAFGKPFILTEDTGLPEVFRKCGILVDTRREEELAEAIKLLNTEAKYNELQKNISELKVSRPWSQIASEYIKL